MLTSIKEKFILEGLYYINNDIEPYSVSRNLLTNILSYRMYECEYDEILAGYMPANIRSLNRRHCLWLASVNGHLELCLKIKDYFENVCLYTPGDYNRLICTGLAEGGHLAKLKQMFNTINKSDPTDETLEEIITFNNFGESDYHDCQVTAFAGSTKGKSIETMEYCYNVLNLRGSVERIKRSADYAMKFALRYHSIEGFEFCINKLKDHLTPDELTAKKMMALRDIEYDMYRDKSVKVLNMKKYIESLII